MSDRTSTVPVPPIASDKITRVESMPFVSRDLGDFGLPGVWVEVDPDEAEQMGAFEETALSAADVQEAEDGD